MSCLQNTNRHVNACVENSSSAFDFHNRHVSQSPNGRLSKPQRQIIKVLTEDYQNPNGRLSMSQRKIIKVTTEDYQNPNGRLSMS